MHCLISPKAGLLVFENASVSRIVNMVPLVFLFFGFSLYSKMIKNKVKIQYLFDKGGRKL